MADIDAGAAGRKAPRLGRVGVWSAELRGGDPGQAIEAAAELDELGFGALWIPGAMGGDLLDATSRLLSATRTTTIATGILNIWRHNAHDVAAWRRALPAATKRALSAWALA